MGDALQGAGAKEAAEERRLEDHALAASRSVISATTATIATLIIAKLKANDGRGTIGEPAADLRALRSNGQLITALQKDMRLGQSQANLFLSDALFVGYSHGLENRTKPLESDQLKFTISITDQDRKDLADYPILGFTAQETAGLLMRRLEEDINRILAAPLTAELEPATVPQNLAVAAESHAQRVASSVGEAYAAGVQAAVREIKRVLIG